MFAHDTFVSIFGTPRPGELDVLAGLVRAALREGYAIVLNEPGTKKPLCPLSATARRQADRFAQDQAAERGEPGAADRRHACGIAHALTEADAGKVTGLVSRLTKAYGAVPNIGVEPGRSRLVCADMDTADQRDAFLAAWEREAPGTAPEAGVAYTVCSPGVQRDDGSWAHSDGGHTWFTLPDGLILPTADGGRGVLTDEGGWSLIWSGLQVLVPPSVRKEGPYALVGSPRPAPPWVLQRIEAEVLLRQERERLRLERRRERVEGGELDPVDAWAADTPWSALLEPRGWSPTGRVDTCSCPTWTAPGPHGSPKSATAHDTGCSKFDSVDGHAPLHIWTDNPPDYLADAPRTLTKLTHEAYADHEGEESAAVIALGLAVGSDAGPMVVDNPFDLDDAQPVHTLSTAVEDDDGLPPARHEPGPWDGSVRYCQACRYVWPCAHAPDLDAEGLPPAMDDTPTDDGQPLTEEDLAGQDSERPSTEGHTRPLPSGEGIDDFSTPAGSEPVELAKVVSEPSKPAKKRAFTVLTSSQLRERPDPEPLVYGVLDRGTVALLSGKFGTYKSFLALDIACHVAIGQAWAGHDVDEAVPVVYIAAEGEVGIKRRVRGWEHRHRGGNPLPDSAFAAIPQRVVLETDKAGKALPPLVDLVDLVKEMGAGLVVFDTLSKSRGKAEENSNSDMAAVMALVIELCRATGATVLLVAHTGYSGEHTRGGSSQEDDADSVFVIKFEDPKSEDRSPDNRRVLHHRKSKDGVLSPPRVLVPHTEVLGTDHKGRVVDTLTLTLDPWEEPTSKIEVSRAERAGREAELIPLILRAFSDAGKVLGRPAAWEALEGSEERPETADVRVFQRAHSEAKKRWSVDQLPEG